MYYTNIANKELQYFHNIQVPNFTIKLTDALTCGLFKVETIVQDSIYKLYPLFYTNSISTDNANDMVMDDLCLICQKQTDTETYITCISDETAEIQDFSNYVSDYYDITDALSTNQFNSIVSLLRSNTIHEDIFNMIDTTSAQYGTYEFDVDGCTVTDMGIVMDADTILAEPKIRLSDNVFHYSTYTLKLDVIHFTGVNILDDVTPSDFIVVDTLELELIPNTWILIPIVNLEEGYIISANVTVDIEHNKPVIQDVIKSLVVDAEPSIIQSEENTELYAQGLDIGGIPVQEGHIIHFFERIEPVITVSASESIIQTGGNTEFYAKVKDSDGSLAKDVKVYFYKEE